MTPTAPAPADIRTDYQKGELLEAEASADPMEQFDRWFKAAQQANLKEVNAMTLATADATGKPSARIVLLKDFDSRGFVFFTNYQSRKAEELLQNPRASLCFFWAELERQVRVDGTVEKVDREQSDRYFHSRPVKSQLGAIVSRQSSVVESREFLEKRMAELTAQYENKVIPLPDYWGGYLVKPVEMEFWQGRRSRLHDRLLYTLTDGRWTRARLSP